VHLGVALGNLGLAMAGPMEPTAHAALVYGISEAAERLGFHSVWAGDHLALPLRPSTPYPYGDGTRTLSADASLLDPFAVLAAVAGRTERVRLGFGVLVLPYRHPLVTAKWVASLDALSGGRVILGVGSGWMPEEFAAVGADFARRDTLADDALAFLRRAFADGEVEGLTLLPTPVQRPGPPIWVGGNGRAALARAVEHGDAWDAPYVDPAHLGVGIERLHRLCEAAGRDPATLLVSVRGLAARDVGPDLLARYGALGVAHVGVTLPVAEPRSAISELEDLARRCAAHVLPA
jgi:probable F420-dependent oxidoreductase